MKRSTTKKIQKPAEEKYPFLSEEETTWLTIMNDTLSPYWSARLGYNTEKGPPPSESGAS